MGDRAYSDSVRTLKTDFLKYGCYNDSGVREEENLFGQNFSSRETLYIFVYWL